MANWQSVSLDLDHLDFNIRMKLHMRLQHAFPTETLVADNTCKRLFLFVNTIDVSSQIVFLDKALSTQITCIWPLLFVLAGNVCVQIGLLLENAIAVHARIRLFAFVHAVHMYFQSVFLRKTFAAISANKRLMLLMNTDDVFVQIAFVGEKLAA